MLLFTTREHRHGIADVYQPLKLVNRYDTVSSVLFGKVFHKRGEVRKSEVFEKLVFDNAGELG
jgi:ABC-type sugar transport system ATPase subunit